MTRRVPGTQRGPILLVLPNIPAAAPSWLKNALAIRNAASESGRCPGCGATADLYRDKEQEGV